MLKYVFKSSLFIVPFVLLYLWNVLFYDVNGNDLIRLGYIPDFYKKTKNELYALNEKKQFFDNFYTDNIKANYDILVLGDSFSEEKHSFTNKLAKNKKVLLIDGRQENNPFQRLIYLINSDFFQKVKVKNIILESVERSVIDRSNQIKFTKKITITNKLKKITGNSKKPEHTFFSNQALLFSYNTIKYLLLNNSFFNKNVYMLPMSKKLFSDFKKKNLLIVHEDISNLNLNNNKKFANNLNYNLNKINSLLERKKIKLYFMICPDKYDMYYEYLITKNLIKPKLIERINKFNKKYIFIDTKKFLKFELKKNTQDLYFYDDTHWSPKAVMIVSDSIIKRI